MPDPKTKRVSKRNMRDPLAPSVFDDFKKTINKKNSKSKAAELKKLYDEKRKSVIKKEYDANKKDVRKKYKTNPKPLTRAQKEKAAGKGGK